MMAAILLQASGGGFGGFLIPLGSCSHHVFHGDHAQQRQRKKVQAMLASSRPAIK